MKDILDSAYAEAGCVVGILVSVAFALGVVLGAAVTYMIKS